MNIDVVTCSIDDNRYEAMRTNLEEMLGKRFSLSFARVTDAVSMAEGYQRGSALGTAEWVVFCHDDIALLSIDESALIGSMQALDVIGVCGTTLCQSPNWYLADPSNLRGRIVAPDQRAGYVTQTFGDTPATHCASQALDGLFLLVRRSVLGAVSFSPDISGFTCYDVDFTYRAHLSRYRVGVVGSLLFFHNSRVEEFSRQKIDEWSRQQLQLSRKFNFWRTFPEHARHKTSPFDPRLIPVGAVAYRSKRRV